MKTKLLTLILLCSTLIYSENYKKVKIYINHEVEIKELFNIEIPVEDAFWNKKNNSLETFVNETQFQKLQNSSLNYEILINDWYKYYENNVLNNNSLKKTELLSDFDYPVEGFSFGSMGGMLTYDEVWSKIDSMILDYPNIISKKKQIGTTLENRAIYSIKISDNPNVDEDETEVLYTALHHSKEPMSMMQMIYYLYYLLENYGSNNEVTYLINNRELYFIPIVNPDGYVYNETTHPNGGGMWRKNRRLNSDGSYGIDLNRNYGYKWGYDDNGSSGEPSSDIFRGTAPFSEPETQTIRDFCINHNFKVAYNFHSMGNLVIYPWGYINATTPDSSFYTDVAPDITQYNNYTWGTFHEIIYGVNGAATDWFYGEQTIKNKILAMTVEIGIGSDGLWPSFERILALAEENVYPNLYLAWVAGGFLKTEDICFDNDYYLISDSGAVTITLKNIGLENISNLKAIASISNNGELLNENTFNIGNINTRTKTTIDDLIKFRINDSVNIGDTVNFTLKYYLSNLLMTTDNFSLVVGFPKTFYIDSLSTLENWEIESTQNLSLWEWDLTEYSFYSEPYSITDSKYGNYYNNNTVTLKTKNYIDLSSLNYPYLKFRTKYDIEMGWDYGQILISTNDISWTDIGGDNAKIGTGSFQPNGEYIYDGYKGNWATEIINLNKYKGAKVYLKFVLQSDNSIQKDGWYIDDIEIFDYLDNDETVSVNNQINLPAKFTLSQNYPNPFNPSTTITYSVPTRANIKLVVYDILGREVTTLVNKLQEVGVYKVHFNAKNSPSSVYYYRLTSGNFLLTKKMLLIK